MVTKELIRTEIEKVQEQHLGALYRVVKALEEPSRPGRSDEPDWRDFIAETYGSMADDPITRGEQDSYESREPLR
jgi:hypothetical protein